MTYRHMAHSTPLFEETYRGEDVLDNRLDKDPIKRMRALLITKGFSERQLTEIESSIRTKVLEDIEFALKSPYPPKSQLYNDLYA